MDSQQDVPNENTLGRTGERVRHGGDYKTACCAVIKPFSQGDVFPACPKIHGETSWSWIPPFVPGDEWGIDSLLRGLRERRGHQIYVADSVEVSDAPAVQVISSKGIPTEEAVGTPGLVTNFQVLLQAKIVVIGDKNHEGHLIRAVAIPWFEILRELERDPQFLYKLSPRKFEELIAGAYKREGWPQVVLTPQSGDGGRDVIATKPGLGSIRFIDQAKRYAPDRKVTADDIRALLGVLTAERNVSKGIVTTTSQFAPGIFQDPKLTAFMPYRLELKDGKQLRDWLLSFRKKL